MIDVTDCDARLPTPDDQGIGYLNALTRLSMILGTVLKTIYRSVSPNRLAVAVMYSLPPTPLARLAYTLLVILNWKRSLRNLSFGNKTSHPSFASMVQTPIPPQVSASQGWHATETH
jgi:hypothetical protein